MKGDRLRYWVEDKVQWIPARFRPTLGTNTADDRGRDRERRVFLSALASTGARSISIATGFVTVPLLVGHLGTERYGLWMAMTSAVGLFIFSDLGIGSEVLNAIARSNSEDDRETARRYVSSATVLLVAIATFFGAMFAMSFSHVSWAAVFNVKSETAAYEAGAAIAVVGALFLIQIPIGLVERVRLGYQEGYIHSLWTGLGNIAGLVMVLIAIDFGAGLPVLIIAMTGTPLIATVLNGLHVIYRRPWLRPSLSTVTLATMRALVATGSAYVVIDVAHAMSGIWDNLDFAAALGSNQYARIENRHSRGSIFASLRGWAGLSGVSQ
jgi:O-antigen/teichoic acid export membrane protein